MPPKIKDLVDELEKTEFVNRGDKGSHRNFSHSRTQKTVTISGRLDDDAKHYQIRAVRLALEESKK